MTTLNSVDENSATIHTSNPTSPIKVIKKSTRIIDTDYGYVNVYIHGDLKEKDKRAIFLTLHDIGSNHAVFEDFVGNPCMSEIAARSIFIHVDLPGQENDAQLYEGSYPSIQELGENLVPRILDDLKVPLCVGLGEGAGANILVRFALKHPQRCLGLVLIHLVSAGVGMLEKLKETFKSGKRRPSEAFQAPESVIALHRFGKIEEEGVESELKSRVANIHPLNLRKYVEAYMNRKDISEKLSTNKVDCLLVVGGKSQYASGAAALYSKMDKSKTSFIKFDDVVDVLAEAPKKLAESMLLFVKGLGFLTSLNYSGLDRQRTLSNASQGSGDSPANKAALGAIGRRRTLSMEDYDVPRPRRLSLTAGQQNGNIPGSPTK